MGSRKLLVASIAAALAMSAAPVTAANDPLGDFDWMAMFVVANEQCVGQSFSKGGLLGYMTRIGLDMGWSLVKIETEAERRYQENFKSYEQDSIAFCAAAKLGRKQFGDAQLKEMQVIY